MKTSVTYTFTGLFVVVAVCYVFFGTPVPKPEVPLGSSGGDAKLLPFNTTQPVRWIQIQRIGAKETVTLERADGKWFLRHPTSYPADKMMAEGLVTALKFSTKSRRMTREKDWDEYGLAHPDLKIGVEVEGNSHRQYLLLGDKSPVADGIFARWEGEKEYFLLDSRMKQAFDRTAYSLREKRVMRLPVDKVEKIHLQTFQGNYEISKQDGKWYWTEPVARIGKKIQEEQVYQLLLLLNELNIKEFLDKESIDGKDFGFLHSAPFLQVWAGKETSVLRLGKEIVDQSAYYGMIEGEKTVLQISKEMMERFFEIFDKIPQEDGAASGASPTPQASASPAAAASPVSLLKS